MKQSDFTVDLVQPLEHAERVAERAGFELIAIPTIDGLELSIGVVKIGIPLDQILACRTKPVLSSLLIEAAHQLVNMAKVVPLEAIEVTCDEPAGILCDAGSVLDVLADGQAAKPKRSRTTKAKRSKRLSD